MSDMRVKVALQETDFKTGTRRIYAKMGNKLSLFYIVATAVTIAILWPSLNLLNKQGLYKSLPMVPQHFIALMLFMVILLFVLKFLTHYSPLRYTHPDGLFQSPREMHIDHEGIHQTSKHATSLTRWSGVMSIEEDSDLILIYIDTTSAYIVPKRFFNSIEEASAFAAQAQEYRKAAHKELKDKTFANLPWNRPQHPPEGQDTKDSTTGIT